MKESNWGRKELKEEAKRILNHGNRFAFVYKYLMGKTGDPVLTESIMKELKQDKELLLRKNRQLKRWQKNKFSPLFFSIGIGAVIVGLTFYKPYDLSNIQSTVPFTMSGFGLVLLFREYWKKRNDLASSKA